MLQRRITRPYHYIGVDFATDARSSLMFSSANCDETYFDNPNQFDPLRETRKSIPFGAVSNFSARAWVSRSLIVDVALPMILGTFPKMTLNGSVEFSGWAFRGPLEVPVTW